MGCVEIDMMILGIFVVLEFENVMVLLLEVIWDWFSVCILFVCVKVSVFNDDFEIFVDGLNVFGFFIFLVFLVVVGFSVDEDIGIFFEVVVDIDKYDWFVGVEFM